MIGDIQTKNDWLQKPDDHLLQSMRDRLAEDVLNPPLDPLSQERAVDLLIDLWEAAEGRQRIEGTSAILLREIHRRHRIFAVNLLDLYAAFAEHGLSSAQREELWTEFHEYSEESEFGQGLILSVLEMDSRSAEGELGPWQSVLKEGPQELRPLAFQALCELEPTELSRHLDSLLDPILADPASNVRSKVTTEHLDNAFYAMEDSRYRGPRHAETIARETIRWLIKIGCAGHDFQCVVHRMPLALQEAIKTLPIDGDKEDYELRAKRPSGLKASKASSIPSSL